MVSKCYWNTVTALSVVTTLVTATILCVLFIYSVVVLSSKGTAFTKNNLALLCLGGAIVCFLFMIVLFAAVGSRRMCLRIISVLLMLIFGAFWVIIWVVAAADEDLGINAIKVIWEHDMFENSRLPLEKTLKCCGWKTVVEDRCGQFTDTCERVLRSKLSDEHVSLLLTAGVFAVITVLTLLLQIILVCTVRSEKGRVINEWVDDADLHCEPNSDSEYYYTYVYEEEDVNEPVISSPRKKTKAKKGKTPRNV